jgi:tripartite-type tricarboxylate transporter receptor subunit TctC
VKWVKAKRRKTRHVDKLDYANAENMRHLPDFGRRTMDRRHFTLGAAALSLSAAEQASAQTDGPIRIIYPFSAGGGGDGVCRILADELRVSLKRNVLVENRTGANGLIAIKSVMAAPPDGATILVTTGPTIYLLPMVENTPSFDSRTSFAPVSLLGRFEFGIVVSNAIGVSDFPQLLAWLKANPEKAAYGVPSNGTIPHFAGTVLEKLTGLKTSRVAYRGGVPMLNDLAGGHLPFAIAALSDVLGQHQAGTMKIVAMSSMKRSPFLPNVPILTELGVNLVADSWYGMWLPAGTPQATVNVLSSTVMAALRQPSVQEKMMKLGVLPEGSSQEALVKQVNADIMQWKPVVEATGYKITQ